MRVRGWMVVCLYLSLWWTRGLSRVRPASRTVTSGHRHQLHATQKGEAGKDRWMGSKYPFEWNLQKCPTDGSLVILYFKVSLGAVLLLELFIPAALYHVFVVGCCRSLGNHICISSRTKTKLSSELGCFIQVDALLKATHTHTKGQSLKYQVLPDIWDFCNFTNPLPFQTTWNLIRSL